MNPNFPTPASNSNRVNSQGSPPRGVYGRGTVQITNTILAGVELGFPAAGNEFYLTLATGPLKIKPSNGTFIEYEQGMGNRVDLVNAFDLIQVRNETSNPIVFSIRVGFDNVIDNRVIIAVSPDRPQIVYPTYPVPNAAGVVNIPDLSGSAFADINGNSWIAISRVYVQVCNEDSGQLLRVQGAGATASADPGVLSVYPMTTAILPSAGNFSISIGGGNINAIVSEIYNAVRPT